MTQQPERAELDYLSASPMRSCAARLHRPPGRPQRDPQSTALVNEAWLKLADYPQVSNTSRLHFKRIAARAMRQVLVEAARRRNADKEEARTPASSPSTKPAPPSPVNANSSPRYRPR